jgi:F5/8 type C domain/Pectate lyase superfamily protein
MEPAHATDGWSGRRRWSVLTAAIATIASLTAAGPARAASAPAPRPHGPRSAVSRAAHHPAVQPLVPFRTKNKSKVRYQGASVDGMTEYQAVDENTNGSVIGPDYTQGQLATEAVGREAVQLTAQGQYVTFTLTAAANAFDLSYALNQGASGTLSVLVDGTKLSQELSLTSQYSYISTPDITGSMTHHFFNDVRMQLGQQLQAGDTVTFEVGSSDTAVPYTIDVADFYQVPAAASQPANSISVVAEGADPTGQSDSTAAFQSAISAANAAGDSVWIPQGTFLISSPLQFGNATIEGAGDWYTTIESNEFIDNTSAVPGPINLSGFAIMGNTVGRFDDSTHNAINGSLGSGWTANGLWIQDTNVGFWLQFGNSGCTVKNTVILSTDADGLNFNGNATNCTVTNNFIRNTGDDGLAIWSYPTADSGITFSGNTVEQPNLANGIADYGGSDNTISGNVIADTNPLGSGLAISNEAFLTPFAPLSGTITVSDNTLIRTGAYNPNWGHPMGAMRFDSYNSAFSGVTVNVSGNNIDDSPYCAYEIVSGGGDGYAVSGVNINGDTVDGTGTVIFQAEAQGSVSVSNVTASNIGVAGVYNNPYPSGSGTFAFDLGSGNSGWSTTPVLTTFPTPGSGGGSCSSSNLALCATLTASGYTQSYVPANANDGNANTYWESTDNAFPQWLEANLGSAQTVGSVTLDLPPQSDWATRTQTITILGSTDGTNWTTLVASTGYTFNPSTGNTVTISLPSSQVQYLQLYFTANTGWPAGQISEFQIYS